MHKKLILSITILSLVSPIQAFFDFDAFDAHFENIEKQMEKMHKDMKKEMKAFHKIPQTKVTVSLKEEDDAVVITFADITTAEATLNDSNDRLSITTPDQRIVVTVRSNMIDIETWQEQKGARKKDEDDTFSAQYIGSSYSSISQIVGSKLLLEKQSTGYDEENSELIVRIPKEVAKKDTPVTINKISKEKSAKEQEKTE
jgi:hypothetical protein